MGAFTIKNQPEKDTPIKKNVEIKDADKKIMVLVMKKEEYLMPV